jgi:two-component system nitrate/nitrite response regulator NarL
MSMQNILFVDDHLLFSDALVFMLRSLENTMDFRAVGSVPEALDVLDVERFSMVMVDYVMPNINGLDALALISTRHPDIPVAILSGSSDPRAVAQALDQGAAGWLSKTMGGEPLVHAIKLMLAGHKFVSPELLRQPLPTPLTRREIDVAELVASGMTDKEIADRLSLQLGTVKVHVKSLLRKFGADNRTKFALLYRHPSA